MVGVGAIRASGLKIVYDQAGHGPPLVLVHSGASDAREWHAQLSGLSDEFTVIAWDEPGAGRSSDVPPTFGLAGYANSLAALIQTLQAPVHLCGISWGGTVVLELYRRRPELAATLILADTYAGWKGSLSPDEVRARVAGIERQLAAPAETFNPTLQGLLAHDPPEELRAVLDTIAADVRRDSLPVALAAMAGADLRAVLPTVAVPTLLIWGQQDARSPLTIARSFARAIPQANLVTIPSTGHMSNLERPDAFNSAVRDFHRALP